MQIWMLTGDKIETACCIAISAGFKSKLHDLFIMKELITEELVTAALNIFEQVASKSLLVMDGQSLGVIFKNKKLQDRFF